MVAGAAGYIGGKQSNPQSLGNRISKKRKVGFRFIWRMGSGVTRQVYLCRAATLPASLAVTTVWRCLLAITKRLVDERQWPVCRFNAGVEGTGIQR
ncbi:protein of unknown function (plasmid) [Cupriavidus taiwanensis]|uniref:Uncharacterized protein n=1 Tax=Cupriavidus taiwanensis TaxID=164546 RepID=A0A375HIT5_9BURK|nr:hypothetical protein CBM2592_B130076 [Cupriavidus taiwanensis]SOY66294.1 hypothetical protein CBM2588_B170076 [Cupriavidus taiwanensis]SOZ27918.1 hypothetical protein CBM2608_B130076 [Cupriavidus taiwanensis]SOZ70460.1 hypothetical protein CBM2617_B160075 [Cupriavidus taiwanensis]SOZ86221.1 hypothetical protein CBM2618_B170078 [Cupriavidus taiwanensis]